MAVYDVEEADADDHSLFIFIRRRWLQRHSKVYIIVMNVYIRRESFIGREGQLIQFVVSAL